MTENLPTIRHWLRQTSAWLEVTANVERVFGVPVDALLSTARTNSVCLPRFACFWALREVHGWSYPDIGAAFARDHSTVMGGLRSLQRRVERDRRLGERLELLRPRYNALVSTARRMRVAEVAS
jgi:chromosomal replication initiator protein